MDSRCEISGRILVPPDSVLYGIINCTENDPGENYIVPDGDHAHDKELRQQRWQRSWPGEDPDHGISKHEVDRSQHAVLEQVVPPPALAVEHPYAVQPEADNEAC